MLDLQPPRHTSTLRKCDVEGWGDDVKRRLPIANVDGAV